MHSDPDMGTFMGIPVSRSARRPKDPRYVALMLFHGQAEGAIPNETQIEKCNAEDGDSWPNGTIGTVLASMDVSDLVDEDGNSLMADPFIYYIDFVADPGMPCLISGKRIKLVDE